MGNYFVDLDGTIIDPKSGMIGAFRRTLQETGYHHMASVDLDWVIGPPVIESFARLLGEPQKAKEALRIYRKYYTLDGLLFDYSVYPDILEAIAELQAAGQVFICTMKPAVLAEAILAKLGLQVGLFGADMQGKIKEKDGILGRAVKQLAIDPATCLVIGDRGSDMIAARKTGMLALGVTWGYGSTVEIEKAGAHALCHSPSHLSKIAKDLLCREQK